MLTALKTAASTFKKIFKYGAPSHIICFGDSLGDNLLITTLCEALADRGYNNVWIKCNHKFLFEGNPHVKLVLSFQALLSTSVLKLFGAETVHPRYTTYCPATDRDQIPEKHIILKMADALHIKGAINNRPAIYLSLEEDRKGRIAAKQIVIATSTSGAKVPMRTKEWLPDRYQDIVDRFANDYQFIQLGAKDDAPLRNVTDLRGKTSVRESAAILKNSMLAITHVGLLMHLARAVDCRAVIVYGGRETPEQSGYGCFENIYSAVACSPCWLHNNCDHNIQCMAEISADRVATAVQNQINLFRVPLTADELHND